MSTEDRDAQIPCSSVKVPSALQRANPNGQVPSRLPAFKLASRSGHAAAGLSMEGPRAVPVGSPVLPCRRSVRVCSLARRPEPPRGDFLRGLRPRQQAGSRAPAPRPGLGRAALAWPRRKRLFLAQPPGRCTPRWRAGCQLRWTVRKVRSNNKLGRSAVNDRGDPSFNAGGTGTLPLAGTRDGPAGCRPHRGSSGAGWYLTGGKHFDSSEFTPF